jgi:uncharacterized heparinase superfamily protein
LVLAADGRALGGEDVLVPAGRARAGAATPFALRFHLGPDVIALPVLADEDAAELRLPGGVCWRFACRGGALSVEDSLWIDGEGRAAATRQLVVTGEAGAGGASLSWAFERAGDTGSADA